MYRFFVLPENIIGANARINREEAHHINKVLRLRKGDYVIVCDGDNYEYEGYISGITTKEVNVEIVEVKESSSEPSLEVVLAQGLPKKNESFDFILQKSTELGVSRIVPLITERTMVKLNDSKAMNRKQRWQRIILEAAKQSHRGRLPVIDDPIDFDEFLDSVLVNMLCIIPWEEEKTKNLKDVLRTEKENSSINRTVVLLIGPEGGFSDKEAKEAERSGAFPVSLGPRILRTETAGIVTLGIVLYELGDLGCGADC